MPKHKQLRWYSKAFTAESLAPGLNFITPPVTEYWEIHE